MCFIKRCYRIMNSPHKMKKLLSVAVIALFAQGNAPAHGLRGFWGGVPDAYSGTVEQAEGAGNAQRWLLCLMLSDGLINSEKADKAVSLISEFNNKVFNQYTEEYGKPLHDAYDFAWTSQFCWDVSTCLALRMQHHCTVARISI